ncbi:MAG: polyprenyl synthetase family protein [Candidatus Brocadiia bacterium]
MDIARGMNADLLRILKPISGELSAIEKGLVRGVAPPGGAMREPLLHLERTKGKLLRPAVVFLVGQMLGGVNDLHRRAAESIELMHIASLVHDDVVDHSSMRRGSPSLNARYGEEVALLTGDYLFARSIELLRDFNDGDAYLLISRFISQASEAEIRQLKRLFSCQVTEADYLGYIEAKTARLFALAAELGAMASGVGKESRQSLSAFGLNFGMAFQIADDCSDFLSDPDSEGKPIFQDLPQGQFTLPLIRLFKIRGEKWSAEWVLRLKENGKQATCEAVELLREEKVIDYCIDRADEYIATSRSSLTPQLAENEVPLFALCDVVLRKIRSLSATP